MFRRVATALLVVGLCGCASQQTPGLSVAASVAPQETPPSYQQAALPAPAEAPVTTQALPTPAPPAAAPPPQARLSPGDQAVVRQLIATSRAAYAGHCPCPYDTDRTGNACGDRSLYARPSGDRPLCYPSDVSPTVISRYRAGMTAGTN
jgi:hypothetical protein